MRDFFDCVSFAVIGVDQTFNIVYINQAAVDNFELQKQIIYNTSFFTLFEDCGADLSAQRAIQERTPLKNAEFKIKFNQSDRWVEVSSISILEDRHEQLQVYFILHDITRKKKQERLFSYLNTAVTSLVTTKDTDTSLRRIADFIVPSFADWFTIDVVKDGEFKLLILKHQDELKIQWAKEYRKHYPFDLKAETGVGAVIKTGKPNFIPVLTEAMIDLGMPDPKQREEIKKIGLYSVIMAPVTTNGHTSGFVNFISSNPERHFDEEDLNFALHFSDLIGLALENTRLHEDAKKEIAARRQNENRFRFWLDAIPHKMWISGPDGEATFYNQQWHDYTGIPDFDSLKKQIWDIIHPDDLAEATRQWPEAVKKGDFIEMENRFRRHDGLYRYHLSRVNPIKDEQGRVNLWVGTSTDIHEQKNYEIDLASANEEMTATNEELFAANEELEAVTEEQSAANTKLRDVQNDLRKAIVKLEESKKRFQLFLDSIPQIAWAGSANGEVIYFNQQWYNYTGLSFEETKNWGWKQVIHPDDLDYNIQRLSEIVRSEAPGEFEIREKDRSGNYRWHLVRMMPLFTPEGKLDEWVGTATDIEDLKKLQRQKDDFISIASHELKTPLTTLKATIQLLYNMKENPEVIRFRKLIDQANKSMYKMSRLVDDLLDVKRFTQAQIAPRKAWFVLSELVNSCCNHLVVTGNHAINISGDKFCK